MTNNHSSSKTPLLELTPGSNDQIDADDKYGKRFAQRLRGFCFALCCTLLFCIIAPGILWYTWLSYKVNQRTISEEDFDFHASMMEEIFGIFPWELSRKQRVIPLPRRAFGRNATFDVIATFPEHENQLKTNDFCFVMYYHNWCPHSLRVLPQWEVMDD